MSEKKSFSKRVESFIGGKGFYIVLFACIAVIGVSAWILLFSQYAPGSEGDEDYAPVMADIPGMPEVSEIILPSVTDEEAAAAETDAGSAETANPVEIPIEEPPAREDNGENSENNVTDTPEPEAGPEENSAPSTEDLTFIWPVSGSVVVEYSPASLIFDKTMGDWRTHDGVDIAAQIGTKVMAVATGTVESVEDDDLYGTVVKIDHGDGLVSVYANLAATPTVKAGDAVTMGSVIGSVGDTALAETGEEAHLHFAMVKDGLTADPADYLPRK